MTIHVFELGGTYAIFGFRLPVVVGDPATNWLNLGLNDNLQWHWVDYPASVPFAESRAIGAANLVNAINTYATDEPFVLVGYSQGAWICSTVYNRIRSGDLSDRNDDLLLGVAFGNPMREAGHMFPGGPFVPGHGINDDRLVGSETRWWEFANPGDIICTTDDSTEGLWKTTIFAALDSDYVGTVESLLAIIAANPNLLLAVVELGNAIVDALWGALVPNAPHASYPITRPIPGDSRTTERIVLDHLNSLAPAAADSPQPLMVPTPVVTGWFSR